MSIQAIAGKKNCLFPLSVASNVIATFSWRQHGNMSLRYGDTKDSLSNRKIFLENLGIDYHNLVCAKQVHASNVRYADQTYIGKGALSYETAIDNTDAFITDRKNIALSVFTADCLSIFLYDPKRPAIGLVHAGYRSSKESIVLKTLNLMEEKFKTKEEDIYVAFGSLIRSCCYEVAEEFSDFFPGYVAERAKRYYLDLIGVNKKQILDLGVQEANIFDSRICTSCRNKDFFSFRKEGKTCGRMISVMMLK